MKITINIALIIIFTNNCIKIFINVKSHIHVTYLYLLFAIKIVHDLLIY